MQHGIVLGAMGPNSINKHLGLSQRALFQRANTKIPKADDQQAFMVMVRDEKNTVIYTASLTFAGLWMGDTPIPEPEQSEE
ncbi:hypothetical protein MKK70_14290 [Methylobacterium sp. E-041]|uniref:hypothetical protein n=1 Tax=unclassified Methylobacterium TaxID=2615210 RepID=UPI001FBA2C5F|nr:MULTISPECIES: hypothetical protein [unclassified Methylobacterium]MCJ2037378.1 hypothetical protein [Methylobacterium sp. J-059]MCJ2106528.1 hypothetical protein [Methylobacterium sp. E-041]